MVDSSWIIPIDPTKNYVSTGKANVVADAFSQSMPPKQHDESKERDRRQLTDDIQDQEIKGKQYLFMTTTSAAGISSKELKDFIDAQKADPVLTKFRELSRVDLTRHGMQSSPPGLLCKEVDGEQLMMVPRELRYRRS